MLSWLIAGVLAGTSAGFIVVRARPRGRADETALAGGLAGTASGVLILLGGALGNGSLGNARMASIGARLDLLAILAPTLLGISGLVTGALLGLFLRPQPEGQEAQETGEAGPDPAGEDTQPLVLSGADGEDH